MLGHRHLNRFCMAAGALALLLVLLLLCFGEKLGLQPASANPGYASRLFDNRVVHTIDLQVEDWGSFVANAPQEEYTPATVVIDGEPFYPVSYTHLPGCSPAHEPFHRPAGWPHSCRRT